MFAAAHLIRELWQQQPSDDADTHGDGAFNDEKPAPWITSGARLCEVLLHPICNQAGESTRKRGRRVVYS